ncbi:hypothetical protein ACFQH6_04365 [Halobacteriaceae archaeon GCM10025711]
MMRSYRPSSGCTSSVVTRSKASSKFSTDRSVPGFDRARSPVTCRNADSVNRSSRAAPASSGTYASAVSYSVRWRLTTHPPRLMPETVTGPVVASWASATSPSTTSVETATIATKSARYPIRAMYCRKETSWNGARTATTFAGIGSGLSTNTSLKECLLNRPIANGSSRLPWW